MTQILIGLLILIALGNGAFLYMLWKKGQEPAAVPPTDTQGMLLLQNQLAELTRAMDNKLGEGTKTMSDFMSSQTNQGHQLMSTITKQVQEQLLEVVKGVTETKESTKQVFVIAEQLSNLEKVLKNQKQRGNLGEASLELVMSNILPPGAYAMQFEFPGGETVDAIIRTKEGFIPVDAKFPLENYTRIHDEKDDERRKEFEEAFKRDLKKRIDETSKYVRPKDGTLPFAFMYIPAEGIYYDLLNDGIGAVNTRSLLDYAQNEKKVIIVSPTTFAAYLQSVLYGFKAFKIEEQAKDIAKNVEALGRHINAYQDYYKKLGASLSTTVNHFNAGTKELGKIEKDVLKIDASADIAIDIAVIDRPLIEGKD
ncbi:MAG: DNA recombination protein RmuC [Candidatus Adlerbacteria bacterium]|nr:DNA recombination protein RmuC [Candidatus Adlerbacteria bacterium]